VHVPDNNVYDEGPGYSMVERETSKKKNMVFRDWRGTEGGPKWTGVPRFSTSPPGVQFGNRAWPKRAQTPQPAPGSHLYPRGRTYAETNVATGMRPARSQHGTGPNAPANLAKNFKPIIELRNHPELNHLEESEFRARRPPHHGGLLQLLDSTQSTNRPRSSASWMEVARSHSKTRGPASQRGGGQPGA